VAEPSPYQEAVLRAIARYNRPPLDEKHLSVARKRGEVEVRFEVEADTEDGFDVYAYVSRDTYIIGGEGWHDHVELRGEPDEEATTLIARLLPLLDGRAGLLVRYAGRHPYRWDLLYDYADEGWEPLNITGLFFFNYLGRRRRVEKRNAWPLPSREGP
jgi:hypothetical protein